jgi:hypothetical protein
MIPKTPVLDLFIGRDGEAWRHYVAPNSWKPGLLRDRWRRKIPAREFPSGSSRPAPRRVRTRTCGRISWLQRPDSH